MPTKRNKTFLIDQAAAILRSDGVIGIPTETVYGLAASIQSEVGLKKIFEIKERPFFDPLIVHVADSNQAKGLTCSWPEVFDLLTERFWPGPLTLIASKNDGVHPLITAGLSTVGLRQPHHPLTQELIRRLDAPLAAPSANKFMRTSPTRASHVRESFPELFVLDGGACDVGLESTILRISPENFHRLEILRPGMISESEIQNAISPYFKNYSVVTEVSKQVIPGSFEHHYQPDRPLVLVERNFKLSESELIRFIQAKLHLKSAKYLELKVDVDPRMAARELYAELRSLAAQKPDFILAVLDSALTQSPLWSPIFDRLKKASSLHLINSPKARLRNAS